MTTYKIALLPGDGIGEETCIEAVKVLDKIEKKYGHKFIYNKQLVGGAAIDGVGEPLPEATIKACEESDAVLFGSVGGPKWDHLPADQRPEVGALLPLRKHFELFANIRPAGVSKALASFSPICAIHEISDCGVGIDCLINVVTEIKKVGSPSSESV